MRAAGEVGTRVRYKLQNIRLDPVSRLDLLRLCRDAVINRSKTLVLHQNLHGIFVERKDARSREIYSRADWVYVDGMPLIWFAKAAGLPFKTEHRVTLIDCFDELLDLAEREHWRIFYLGGTQEVLDMGIAKIISERPSLAISGRNGFFQAEENKEVLSQIHGFQPDLLFVGLGMPVQEHWIAANYDALQVPFVTTSGATMEYTSGHSQRPAAWAGRLGLYGLFRFLAQPKRLWRRYLLEPLVLTPYILGSILSERRKTLSALQEHGTPAPDLP